MSSLIPERQIVISPALATTIGLEEAVLLHVLNDASSFCQSTPKEGFLWLTISITELGRLLPFWNEGDFQRISTSLHDKGVSLTEPSVGIDQNSLRFAMNETPKNEVIQARPVRQATPEPQINRRHPARADTTRGASLLADNWQPTEDLLQLLSINHSIPKEFALEQREDFLLYWRDRQQVSHSWPSKFRQHVLKQWRFHQSGQAEISKANRSTETTIDNQPTDWRPSHDVLEILHRDQVNPEFIEDAVPEFLLYWRERGEASNTWNSKFLAHIRRQWAIYTKTMELDYEPREIAANWQPSEDVFDILKLANIDISFARQLVAEFVLFWRDTKQIQRSWNTKFLQHTKYQWATRHQLGQQHAGQQVFNRSGKPESKSTFEHLTDRSWAKGLVEDQ
jgi:hypothetical protein